MDVALVDGMDNFTCRRRTNLESAGGSFEPFAVDQYATCGRFESHCSTPDKSVWTLGDTKRTVVWRSR